MNVSVWCVLRDVQWRNGLCIRFQGVSLLFICLHLILPLIVTRVAVATPASVCPLRIILRLEGSKTQKVVARPLA